jgi:hypothetical protein
MQPAGLLYSKALPNVASRGGEITANEKFVHYDEREVIRLPHKLRETGHRGIVIGQRA